MNGYDAPMPMESITREAIDTLLKAIESRDLRAVRRALHPDACWQNVPHPAAEGREAVIALLHGILCWSERVQWDVVRASIEGASGSVERVDRFWLQGEEHAVACHGVFSVDIDTRTVISVRDYVDLGEWRQRVNPVLHALASRTSAEVINGHLAALQKGVPLEVAAYFSLDAIIECPAGKVTGWDAVADYFATSDAHPGLNQLAWEAVQVKTPEEAAVDWRLPVGKEAGQLGRDHYEIRNGRIVRLVTTLQLNAL
jgi:limonene-1,2-epoxide hydrolase